MAAQSNEKTIVLLSPVHNQRLSEGKLSETFVISKTGIDLVPLAIIFFDFQQGMEGDTDPKHRVVREPPCKSEKQGVSRLLVGECFNIIYELRLISSTRINFATRVYGERSAMNYQNKYSTRNMREAFELRCSVSS